jgi:hypothetical protein
MKKLDKLDKFELVDIVHKAKCGKLQGLNTKDMTKEQLVEHLYNSKCPEVHEMITEITELKDDLGQFVEKYVDAGNSLTVDQIYYSGMQEVIMSIFFYEAWKNKRYDCILHNGNQNNYSKFSFRFSVDETVHAGNQFTLTALVKHIGEQMSICIKKGIKIIAIPIQFDTRPGSGHANAIIYRVDSKTFERFEPHGATSGTSFESMIYKDFEKARDELAKKYKEEVKKKNDKKASAIYNKIDKLQSRMAEHKYNINSPMNDLLEKYFTKVLPKLNPDFKGSKYISPDIVTEAIHGFQSIEPTEIRKKYKLSPELYTEKIGGFCVMWSIMYFDLVFRFPKATPAVLNKSLLDLLEKKGEFAFGELALGYLQGFKRYIDKFLGKTDYSTKDKRENLAIELEKFVTID